MTVGNLRAASVVQLLFTSKLSADHPSLTSETVSVGGSDARIYPSLPLLNFLTLLLLACQKGAQDLFRSLRTRYRAQLGDVAEGNWDEVLDMLGEAFFGIQQPRQNNPLMDMMSSMFGGGMGGGGGAGSGQRTRGLEAPAPAPGLD